MKRKTRWILGLSFGIPLLLIAVLLLVLRLSSPPIDVSPVELKELPSILAEESEDPDAAGDAGDAESLTITEGETMSSETVIVQPTLEDMGLPLSGALVMMAEGRRFGEESYEISLQDNVVALASQGTFQFKALIATITLTFDQQLHLDSQLRPRSLDLSFDAPLGLGRSIHAEFSDGFAAIGSGDTVDVFPVDLDRAYVLGTFSTYAIIPLLYELRQITGEVSLETLVFGGPPSSGDSSAADTLPETRIVQKEDTVIAFDARQLIVSQYEISGDMGTMVLYALGTEFLGLFAGDEDDSLFVYRADYFENGFEVE